MTIHKEGRKFLIKYVAIYLCAIFGAFYIFREGIVVGYVIIGIMTFFLLIFLNFFRIPSKKLTKDDSKIISPCDGKVVVIEQVEEPEYFKDKRKQVSIFMSPLNVHNNVNPISGKVTYFKYHPGKYLMAFNPKSSTHNEKTTFVTKHQNGTEILFRQVAGFLARRICWYAGKGDVVEQSEEFGFIKFGSRIDVFLPLDAKIDVEIGQKTVGGQTILASF